MSHETVQTVVYAVPLLALVSSVFAPIARRAALVVVVVGCGALSKGQPWAVPTLVAGVCMWLVGHWAFIVRNGGRYRSHPARAVFENTPLRIVLPGWWRSRRARPARVRHRRDAVVLPFRPGYQPPDWSPR